MTDDYATSQTKEEEGLVKMDANHTPDVSGTEAITPKELPPAAFLMLRQSVEDAYYLHNYSITTGKEGVPEEVSTAIVKFKRCFDQGKETEITTTEEVEFSAAYRKLAALMLPVTVGSLRDTEDVQYDPSRPFFERLRLSKARQVIFVLPLFAIFLIFFIIYCEIIQSIFLASLQDIATKETQIEQLDTQVLERQQQLDSLKQLEQRTKLQSKGGIPGFESSEPEGTEDLTTQSQLETQVQEQRTQLMALEDHSRTLRTDTDARLKSLKSIWDNIPLLLSLAGDDEDQEDWVLDADIVVLVRMKFELLTEVLNRILPILYGALGTTAYFLRMLIPLIRNRTFSQKRAGTISVRICLGMLSGIAIQWFLIGDQEQAQLFERSLSTSALAFLAGYSVDLLFNIMDRLIASFKSPGTSQSTSKVQEEI